MTTSDKPHQPGRNQVPGQFLGYGLQYTRMLSLLLQSDKNATVSLEVFEDVGVEGSDAPIASQVKSSITKNPVSNRAEPFWKSLGNWLDAIKSRQLSAADTVFELYVFGDFQGDICTLFSKAESRSEAATAIIEAEKLLQKDGGQIPDHVRTVLNADRDTLITLITHFRYRHGSGASKKDLEEQLSRALIPDEFSDRVLTHAMGWVKQQVDSLIESGQPAAISVAAFRAEIEAYVRSLAFSDCFADMAGPARPEEIEGHRSRRYVRQLDLISVPDERKLRAISSYLRSSVNRMEWGRLALVHEHSLDDFEHKLEDYWRNTRDQCEIALTGKDPLQRGRYLLAECLKCSAPLQGRSVPHDFVEGCFHDLADELIVGWHPNFEALTKDWS